MGLRRYPGATPFSRKQANIFYGRDKDIDKLLTLIQVEKKVLLYSKSGLGKTSLLEAGVLPKLPNNYTIISIRLFAYKPVSQTPTEDEKKEPESETPLKRVINALKTVVNNLTTRNDTIIDQIIGNNEQDKTLWYYFKKAQLLATPTEDDEPEKIFTLVFDQFEELFSFPKKDIDDFKNQLYELTELKLPDRFAVLIAEGRENNRELFSRETIGLLHKKIDIKTIFAIRSDRLSLLNNLSDKLPNIQSTFYELLPLDYEQAIEAIVNPAADNNPAFETPPFTFHDDAIEKIIKELSNDRKDIIETTQLQIVCHRIEEIAAAKTAEGQRQIEVEDLPEFKNIFLNFYFDSIGRLVPEKQDKAKRLIEDKLILNHQRISLDEEICKEYLAEKELRNLVDTHLLRAERNTFGRFSYEISHDTLVEPILESQKKYRDELERIRLENEQKEELRKLREQQELEARKREEELRHIREEQERVEKERQRKMRQQRRTMFFVSVVAVILFVIMVFAFQQMRTAKNALRALKSSEFIKNYTDAKTYEEDAQYQQALDKYNVAKGFLDSLDVKKRIQECERLIPIKDEHEKMMSKADTLLKKREYYDAMRKYNEAFRQGYDTNGVKDLRKDLYDIAIEKYNKDLKDYNKNNMDDSELHKITERKKERLIEAFKDINQ